MIRPKTALILSQSWHGGQWSALYQFASSGVYMPENALRYLQEIEDCLHPEYAPHPGMLSEKDALELSKLKCFFRERARRAGLEIEYKEHSVYGYLIPYIASSKTDIEVTPLQYLS